MITSNRLADRPSWGVQTNIILLDRLYSLIVFHKQCTHINWAPFLKKAIWSAITSQGPIFSKSLSL